MTREDLQDKLLNLYDWLRTAVLFAVWFVSSFPIPTFVLTVIVIAAVLFGVRACRDKDSANERKADQKQSEAISKQAEINQAEAEADKAKVSVNAAEKNSQTAEKRESEARQKDSQTHSGNFTDAERRFCKNFCNDSACDELRKRGECR